jgi:hypothetical protein
MMTKKRKTTSKPKNKKLSRKAALKKAIARAPKKAVKATHKKLGARPPLEFVRPSQPSVTVYELVETEVYEESNPGTADHDEEFGT